ncbi:MAG: hypothetical protein VX899_16610 [Myxococcota bacterium]|nr:hypothetical protein [Myxococcota bacterium]
MTLLLTLLACQRVSAWVDGRDGLSRFEYGDSEAPDYSFWAWDVVGVECTDPQGVKWLYVHAATTTTGGDCDDGFSLFEEGETGLFGGFDTSWDTARDTGPSDTWDTGPQRGELQDNYNIRCGQVSDAFAQVEGLSTGPLTCGEGMVPNNGRHQIGLWFSGFDRRWPMDAAYVSGTYKSCDDDAVPAGLNPSITDAFFTPDLYSDELLVSGSVHGVAEVEYCF